LLIKRIRQETPQVKWLELDGYSSKGYARSI
jgi:hypothetical protein